MATEQKKLTENQIIRSFDQLPDDATVETSSTTSPSSSALSGVRPTSQPDARLPMLSCWKKSRVGEADLERSGGMNKWWILFDFQTKIARRWQDRGGQTNDPFAQFFFYFAAFNALYFLWKCIDQTGDEQGPNEGKQIENLLSKFTESEAGDILGTVEANVTYFLERRPIRRMNRGSPRLGDDSEGRRWQRKLRDGTSSVVKLNALAQIIYLVRSNLAHGSKVDSGDDKEIIRHSLPPLQIVAARALEKTREKFAMV